MVSSCAACSSLAVASPANAVPQFAKAVINSRNTDNVMAISSVARVLLCIKNSSWGNVSYYIRVIIISYEISYCNLKLAIIR